MVEPACSDESGLLEQEEEWAFLLGSGVRKLCFTELAFVPELKPVEIVRALHDVIVHTTVLEEELLVAPVRADRVRSAYNPANESFLAAELGRFVEGKHLEHGGVHWDDRHLVLKVVLVLIGPAVDIVRLDLQFIGPVRILNWDAVLVELGELHN